MNPEKVLPPGVNGKITGYLMVKVDEIFWARNSPGEVFVELQWWGEKDSTIFRPEDISENEPKKNTNSSVTYNIRTSPGLFESYLRNCGRITFTVLRGQNKNVVLGTAVVKDVEQIISLKNYHSYFSVFSPKGNRIGDLHICFELTFKHTENRFTLKHHEGRSELKSQHVDLSKSSKCKSSSSEEDKLLSNILQKGHELRKAMVMSVLADCPADKVESIVDYYSDPTWSKKQLKKEETKLVDFLLGKHMSAEEEMKALETLRCMSPAENLIEIAKVDGESSKVTKSKCCLHGHECERNVKLEIKESKLTQPVSQLSSETNLTPPSSIIMPDMGDEAQHIEDEIVLKRKNDMKFNCYRIVISTLKLTLDGNRKIFYMPGVKENFKQNLKYGRNHNPPGTSFILEASLPSKTGGKWSRTVKFLTKNFKGLNVDFSQGSTHRLCGSVNWSRVRTLMIGTVFTIYWRHLNQRVPCPLGSTRLEQLNPAKGANSVSLRLPVYSNTRLLTGYLSVTISLGTLESLGEEMMFHIKKKDDGYDVKDEDLDDIPSLVDAKVDPEPHLRYPKSDSPIQSDSDDVVPIPSLDEELMKAIDLLNSKPDKVSKKNPVIEKQEACVQTTLPLTETETDCSVCQCKKSKMKELIKPMIIDHNEEHVKEHSNIKTPDKEGNIKMHKECNDEKLPRRKENYYEDYFHPNLEFPCTSRNSENTCLPMEFPNETIHEFTVKIEKIVGVPMFTGDKDMDCYIDYSFPKVDCNRKMVFDRVTNGTDIRMALRETEFGNVNRHRLRLNCKLTTALLSLPKHEITFSIWGRFYRPSPRDYRLGKATVPFMRLTTLELVFCQQIKREPIFEKLVVPINVVESSMTSGYKGSFGDLHIILGYSCASGRSYRQWRERSKENNDLYNEGISRNINSEKTNYINPMYSNTLGRDKAKPWECPTQDSQKNVRDVYLDSPTPIQSNFKRDHVQNFKESDEFKMGQINDVYLESKKIMASPCADYNMVHEVLPTKDTPTNDNFSNTNKRDERKLESSLGNVVKEVLGDIKGRQVDNNRKHLKTIPLTTETAQLSLTDLNKCDPFESFDLKVDLPMPEESIDFDARSQYSFLCTPPPIPPLVPSQSSHFMLESDSSCSLKDKIQARKPINPFSSVSNMSCSINSECSMFKTQHNQKDGQHCSDSNALNLAKNHPSNSNRQIEEIHSANSKQILSETNKKSKSANSDSGKGVVSSDATLNSVESLKSYKDEPEGRISKDIGVETDFIAQHKDTQTSCSSYKEEECFKARVQICRALGLPSVEVRQLNGKIGMVKPTSCAYFSAIVNGKPTVLKTDVIEKKSNPIWNASWNVELPVEFLKKSDRELEIFVELSGGTEDPPRGSDCSSHWPIVLRTGVDLTPITAGLEHASGWFSLSDRALLSRAQLKVVVTPLEDAGRFRDAWLKEYTKAKGKKLDINIQHSSSIATSLQEKLKELEKLTQRMKNKMDERPNWNMSPPFELLSEVQGVNFTQDQIVPLPRERWSGSVQKVETSTSPIVISSSDSCRNSPTKTSNYEDKSVVQTYTVGVESDSSQQDSLETPSQTIDRILTKMRTNR